MNPRYILLIRRYTKNLIIVLKGGTPTTFYVTCSYILSCKPLSVKKGVSSNWGSIKSHTHKTDFKSIINVLETKSSFLETTCGHLAYLCRPWRKAGFAVSCLFGLCVNALLIRRLVVLLVFLKNSSLSLFAHRKGYKWAHYSFSVWFRIFSVLWNWNKIWK